MGIFYGKKTITLILIGAISLGVFTSNTVLASELNAKTTLSQKSSDKVIEENNEFIKIEDNKGITIIYKDLLNKEYDTNEDDFSNISRMARYTVKGVRDLGEYIDRSNALETVSGNSGMTLNLTLQKSISSSASVTFGVSNSVISNSVGFNVSKSYSVSHSGSYKVPSNVNRAVVTAYPLYNKYEYGIYLRGRMGQPDVRMKTGYALKSIGIHYEKSFR